MYLYDLRRTRRYCTAAAHVAGGKPSNLHDLRVARICWIGSVLHYISSTAVQQQYTDPARRLKTASYYEYLRMCACL